MFGNRTGRVAGPPTPERPRRSTLAAALLAVLSAVCAVAALPAGVASAGPIGTTGTDSARWAADWLIDEMAANGGIVPGFGGSGSDLGATAEAVVGLAVLSPADATATFDALAARLSDVTVVGGADVPGRLAQMVLAALAVGRDPSTVGGSSPANDLPARLLATQAGSGLFGATDPTYDGVYRQSQAILALAGAGRTVPASTITWLKNQQCDSGGWPSFDADTTTDCSGAEDSNATAMALLALRAAGVAPDLDGVAFLTTMQNSDGGFGYAPGSASDANSTALVLEAITALGRTSSFTRTSGATPLGALRSFQYGCGTGQDEVRGGYTYQWGQFASPNHFATVQALLPLAGVSRPLSGPVTAPGGTLEFVCANETTTTTTTTVPATTTTVPATTTTTPATTTTAPATTTTAPATTTTTTTAPATAPSTTAVQNTVQNAAASTGSPASVRGASELRGRPLALTGRGTSTLLLVAAVLLAVGAVAVGLRRWRSTGRHPGAASGHRRP